MLNSLNKFYILILGNKGTHYQAPSIFKNAINISEFANPHFDTTLLGLEIEALKASEFFVTVSPNITLILSFLLGTPSLFWGNHVKEYTEVENVLKTYTKGINDPLYTNDTNIIFKNIMKEL
jgi:hypothetical protein